MTLSRNLISADRVRLSDLSIGGWLGLGASAVGLGTMFHATGTWALGTGEDVLLGVIGGLLMTLFGAAIAYENGKPECEARCDACGQHVLSHASRDGVDEFVEVHRSGSPRRLRLGPLSLVTETARDTWTYCSGDCAAADAEGRFLVGHLETEANRVTEVGTDD